MEQTKKKNPVITLLLSVAALFILFSLLKACGLGRSSITQPQPTLDRNKSSYAHQYFPKDFATYPDKYKGDKISVKCEVFNIISDSQFQCWTIDDRDPIAVITDGRFSTLYEEDVITVYGTVDGKACGKNAMGGEVCQPLLVRAWFSK